MKKFVPFQKNRLVLCLATLLTVLSATSQTYTTVAAGNWSSPSTWSGGTIPNSTVGFGKTINIKHRVVYDLNTDLNIFGDLNITGDTLHFNNKDINVAFGGNLNVLNGGLLEDLNNGGNLIVNGGYVNFTNAKIVIGDDIQALPDSRRFYNNSYVQSGGNYTALGNGNGSHTVLDTVVNSIIKAWPANGGNADIRYDYTTVRVSNAQFYSSHDLRVANNGHMLTLGAPNFAIDTINVSNNLVNEGDWKATINAYCTGSGVQGSKAGLIDFTKPSICSNPSELVFSNPVLIAGTDKQDGATYKFNNVSYGLDATIQVTKRSAPNVQLYSIDVTNTGWAKAFQPQVGIPGGIPANSAAWMEFNVKFYRAGTSQLAKIKKFYVTALDVDGDAGSVAEFVQFEKADSIVYSSGSTLKSNTPLLTNNESLVDDLLDGATNLLGSDVLSQGPVANGAGVDTSNIAFMVSYTYLNKNDFKFIIGSKNGNVSLGTQGPALKPLLNLAGTPVIDPTSTSLLSGDPGLRLNSIWFKQFNLNVLVTLPVKLLDFTANYTNPNVLLQWSTAQEHNFSHFILERSTDGENFSQVALVFGEGESNQKLTYSYTDKDMKGRSGIIYYRLKQVDVDGKFSYSAVRIIRLGDENTARNLAIFPNPVASDLKITLPSSWQNKHVQIDLFNAGGQLIYSSNIASSSQTESVSVASFDKGVYFIKARCGDEVTSQRFIKN